MHTPGPKPAVADRLLIRPDWIAGQPRDPRMLWLDKNENLDPELGTFVHNVISSLNARESAVYPDVGPLYRKLAAFLLCGPDQIMLTAGSDAAIASVFQAFVSVGDAVVHTSPTFAMYGVYCQIFGARTIALDYRRSPAGPQLDVDHAIATIRQAKPKLVCVPNPDSPTGTVLLETELRALIEAAGDVSAVMVVDEAYFPFYPHTLVPWTMDYPNLVVIRSASKCWGLAGLRVGYAVACPSLAATLHKVKPMYEIGNFAATVFGRLLDEEARMLASVARLLEGKAAFVSAMTALKYKTLDTNGNFQHVAFAEHAEAVHLALGDLVYYRRDFDHPSLKGFSRFSATTVAQFAPVIERIRSVTR